MAADTSSNRSITDDNVVAGAGRRTGGATRSLQPDVANLLEVMASFELPPIESLPVDDARAFMLASSSERPPGPEVGEIVDGVLPGAAGDLHYRLYRPGAESSGGGSEGDAAADSGADSDGPLPIVVYFHGGGWVLGSHESDDPFCRELCAQSGAIIVSVDYRHAPEARFPAAPDDGFAAVQWVAANASVLGGVPDRLAVAGWSAGANVAAVVCHTARDAGGPRIVGQMLLNPVTDCDVTRPSYRDNGDGYALTTSLMGWFWDHYADPADRANPKASPLRADSLAGLPPALVVTAQFDPLRDEGVAYADALQAAGVDVRHLPCAGHIHTSMTAVDIIGSGAAARAEMGAAIRGFFTTPPQGSDPSLTPL